MAVLVNASRPGLRNFEDAMEAANGEDLKQDNDRYT